MRQLCIRFVAFGLLFMLSAGALWLYPNISQPLLILSGISFLVATGIRIKMWRDANTDPYSLSKLNEIIQEGTYDEDEILEVDHQGDKFCLCCQHVYGSQFGVCPKCGR